jgi:hypothetical protein
VTVPVTGIGPQKHLWIEPTQPIVGQIASLP